MENNNIILRPIFIGGTGRSGTSLLKEILNSHADGIAIPVELRIITDPGGLLDLISALGCNWSPYRADFAIHEFRKLVENTVTTSHLKSFVAHFLMSIGMAPAKYATLGVGDYFGHEHYRHSLNRFLDQVVLFHSSGRWHGSPPYRFKSVIEEAGPMADAKASEIAADFISALYANVQGGKNARFWIDDTPFNILEADRLFRLFPNSFLINVYRHPMDVVASHMERVWGSNQLEAIVRRIANVYRRWFDIRSQLAPSQFTEIKLEDALLDPEKEITHLCHQIGIETDEGLLEGLQIFDAEKAHTERWREDLSGPMIDLCMKELQPVLSAYNYPTPIAP